jgi:phospholipase/carboxylesterase
MELMHTAHVPAGEGPFPTIVLLHGWGANAHDLFGLAPFLHGGRAVVLCPQGPLAFEVAPGFEGYGWFDLSRGLSVDPTEVERACRGVSDFIAAAAARYPIDEKRVLLAGFSQGGFIAYRIALSDPARFAGLMALSSWLPNELVSGMVATPAHAQLSTLVVHGLEDPMIPIERGRESRDALLALGIPTVYREFPMGHEISPEALRTIVDWIDDRAFPSLVLA